MRSLALALFVLLSSFSNASDSIESKLGFRLTSPGAGWRLLDEEGVRDIQPRAVAGLVSNDELYNVVVVENLPADSLTELARYWADNSGLDNAKVNLFEELRFNDLPAVRWMVSGESAGTAWSQHFVIFIHGQSLFRLVSWANSAAVQPDGSSFEPFMESFSFLKVEHAVAPTSELQPEHAGIGWLSSKGMWKSSAHGMAIELTEEWSIVTGEDLLGWDLDADIGILDNDSHAKLTLGFERLDRRLRTQRAADFFKQAASEGVERREAILMQLAGEEIELRVYDPSTSGDDGSVGMRRLVGYEPREEHCIRIRVDYPIAREGAALENLRAAFAAMRVMEREERLGVEARIESSFEEINEVGDGYSLRGGMYRDFRFGLSWKRPSLQWQVETGAAAIARVPDSALTFSNPYWDIQGAVIPVPVQTLQTEDLHAHALAESFPPASFEALGEVRRLKLGEVEAQLSLLRPTMSLAPNEYRLVTAANDSWAFKIHVWGSPSSLSLASEELEAALLGFAISASPTPAKNASSGALYDDRLGFQLLSPGEDWKFTDRGKDAFWPAGDLAEWVRGEDECVGVIAVCGLTDKEDVQFLGSLVRHGFPESFGEWIRKEPETREMYFCGQSVRELSWNKLGRKATCWTIYREQTLYLVYATDEAGEFDSERVCDLFSLLP